MASVINSFAISGIDAYLVEIESDTIGYAIKIFS